MSKNVISLKAKRDALKSFKKKPRKKSFKDLEELSDLSFEDCETDLERLYKVRELLEKCLPVADGLFKDSPSRSNVYALTNIVDRYQNVNQQIIDINNSAILDDLINSILRPFIEKLILDLGVIINESMNDLKVTNKTKKFMDTIYREYGTSIETKLPTLEKEIKQLLR